MGIDEPKEGGIIWGDDFTEVKLCGIDLNKNIKLDISDIISSFEHASYHPDISDLSFLKDIPLLPYFLRLRI